ncbi:MAG TPA: hypothetical protein VF594_01495 [Rubricoccaceae bacterium]|jgi:hypothetical protein
MIVAEPTSLFRQTFTLSDTEGSGEPFGEVALRLFRGGRLTVGDADYEFQQTGLLQQALTLTLDGAHVAASTRPSVFRRRTVVTFSADALGTDADLTLDLEPEGWFGRRWNVFADGLDVGRADWTGRIRSRLNLDVSDALPLVVRAFLVTVLVVQRRNERNNS